MGLRAVLGDNVLASSQRGAGTHTSGPIANPGVAADVWVGVQATAVSGTSPTLDVSLEQSSDGSSYSAVTGSSITQLTAAGNRLAFARVTQPFVRVTSTVGGSATPTVTFAASVKIVAE